MEKKIMILFYIFMAILLGLIIGLSLSEPQDNLISWQMAVVSGGMFLGMTAFGILLKKFCLKLSAGALKKVNLTLIVILFAALYLVGCFMRNLPSTLYDYGIVYNNAVELARGGSITDNTYYACYSNNIMPMIFFSKIIRPAEFFRMSDPYYMVALAGTAMSIIAIGSSLYIINYVAGGGWHSVFLIALFVAFVPLWIITPTLYTDQMSFFAGVLAIALLIAGSKPREKTYVNLICYIGAGMVLAAGVYTKVTVMIPFIAGFVALIVVKGYRQGRNHFLLIWIISVAFIYGGVYLWSDSQNWIHDARNRSDPVIAWIGLGMYGDGSWNSGREFRELLHVLPTKAEKTEFAKSYIFENKQQFIDLNHLIAKVRRIYASGYMGAKDYVYYTYPGYENHFLWELCSPWGKHYWRGSQYTFGFMFGVYYIFFTAAIFSVYRIINGREIDTVTFIIDISFVGYFLFLMLWEANNRQLYNFVPLLFLGAVLHLRQILEELSILRERCFGRIKR